MKNKSVVLGAMMLCILSSQPTHTWTSSLTLSLRVHVHSWSLEDMWTLETLLCPLLPLNVSSSGLKSVWEIKQENWLWAQKHKFVEESDEGQREQEVTHDVSVSDTQTHRDTKQSNKKQTELHLLSLCSVWTCFLVLQEVYCVLFRPSQSEHKSNCWLHSNISFLYSPRL